MVKKQPRVISLVPSWTETLLAAGVEVVGRTRFCIHPNLEIKNIPIVGGTKSVDLFKIQALDPDFVVLDRQENTLPMADKLQRLKIQMLVTDVRDFKTLTADLSSLAVALGAPLLKSFADRYSAFLYRTNKIDPKKFMARLIQMGEFTEMNLARHIDYVIWKNPYMVIGADTFIAENLKLIAIEPSHAERYPKISENDLKKSFCLFSSEPFPFASCFEELRQLGFQGIVVDGEKLSWFGIRNLNFLESIV